MMQSPKEKILILDFGSQYTQLIARRVREFHIYSQIVRFDLPAAELRRLEPSGLILSGGPNSVYDAGSPQCDPAVFSLGVPVLGVCYGLQLMAARLDGRVTHSDRREFGHARLEVVLPDGLFANVKPSLSVWMSHGDQVTQLPPGFVTLARTETCAQAAVADLARRLYGVQFHPEVVHTEEGRQILANFCRDVCGCHGEWTMETFIERTIRGVRETVGRNRVILGLSGGVDSSVAAALLHRAIGDQLVCIFINNGVLRLNEAEEVQQLFRGAFRINLDYVDASTRFLSKLVGATEPEQKRKIIGHEFVRVFEEEAARFPDALFLGQGTTYPDVIESVPIGGNPSSMIKSHHNVGGLPAEMKLKLIEPLKELFKDEVREVGAKLGLPREVVWRQPFPGPGLAVRIIGEVTPARLEVLRRADRIVVDEMLASGYYYEVWQSFAVLLPVQSVGVMGDARTYEHVAALRIVTSQDGMTADWAKLPPELLGRIANRIINEVRGINRVCYDISSKPPSTIEWE